MLHNYTKERCAFRESGENCSCHSFPDFENPGRQHPDLSDGRGDCFRRVDFVKGKFVTAEGVDKTSPGEDERAADVEKQLFDAGYQEGMLAGRQAVEIQLQVLAQNLHRTVHEVNRISQELYTAAHTHVVELALAVARKIIDREVTVNRSVVIHSLNRALEGLSREAEVTVVMHPDDLNFIKKLPPGELPAVGETAKAISFETDPAMAPGGCMVRTAAGDRDASIGGQMDVVAMAFEEALQQSSHVLTVETSDEG